MLLRHHPALPHASSQGPAGRRASERETESSHQRERIVPVGVTAITALRAMLEDRGRRPRSATARAGGAALEPGRTEALIQNCNGGRLTARSMQRIVARRLAGVTPGLAITPHALRHSFASHLLDRGAEIRAIQELLGHASLASTQIYTRVSPAKLRKAYNQAHPRAE